MEDIKRRYYTMSEVSRKVGVPASQIRYWSSYFKIFKDRTPGKERKFTLENIAALNRINHISKTKYFTLEGMKAILVGRITYRYHTGMGKIEKDITPDTITEKVVLPSKVDWNKNISLH